MERTWEDLDLRSICKDILKNLWVIVLAGLAVYYGITGFFSLRYEPEYTSTATLAVTMRGNNGGSYSSLYLTKDMAGIFSEVFKSEALRDRIAEDLGVDAIEGTISISLVQETNLMNLTVTSNTSRNAYQIIQSALDNYNTVSDYLFSNAKLDVLKEPSVPYAPSNPFYIGRKRMMLTIAAAGFVMMLIALLSFLRPTIKSEEHAKKQLEGRFLGSIPYVRKYQNKKEWLRQCLHMETEKRSVLISSVMLGVPFIESNKKIATSLEHHLDRHNAKILLVTSVEENEGKSSVAANIALALAEKGKRVLLVDADLKKPALYRIFDRPVIENMSISDVLDGKKEASDILTEVQSNVFAAYQYQGVHNSSVYASNEKISELLMRAKEQFDYILLDTPPMALSADAEILLTYVESAVMVVRQDLAEAGEINDAVEVIRQSECRFAGIILNAVHRAAPWKLDSSVYGYGMYDKYSKNNKQR